MSPPSRTVLQQSQNNDLNDPTSEAEVVEQEPPQDSWKQFWRNWTRRAFSLESILTTLVHSWILALAYATYVYWRGSS